jgi:hypothetical protein
MEESGDSGLVTPLFPLTGVLTFCDVLDVALVTKASTSEVSIYLTLLRGADEVWRKQ